MNNRKGYTFVRFSIEELAYIRQNVGRIPIREIASYIGCSTSAISYRMRKENLHG